MRDFFKNFYQLCRPYWGNKKHWLAWLIALVVIGIGSTITYLNVLIADWAKGFYDSLSNLEIEIQIFIKNKKINLEKNKKYIIENNNSIISKQYINYLEKLNNNKKTTNKEYYLIIKNKNKEKLKEIILKINEQLNQCKNKTEKLNKNEIEELIKTTLIKGDE